MPLSCTLLRPRSRERFVRCVVLVESSPSPYISIVVHPHAAGERESFRASSFRLSFQCTYNTIKCVDGWHGALFQLYAPKRTQVAVCDLHAKCCLVPAALPFRLTFDGRSPFSNTGRQLKLSVSFKLTDLSWLSRV